MTTAVLKLRNKIQAVEEFKAGSGTGTVLQGVLHQVLSLSRRVICGRESAFNQLPLQLQHVIPTSQLRENERLSNNDLSSGRTGLLQPSNGHKSNPEGAEDDMEPSAADNLKSLVQECGVSPHKISELLQELPPQRLSDVLIDYYFTAMSV